MESKKTLKQRTALILSILFFASLWRLNNWYWKKNEEEGRHDDEENS